MGLANVDAFIIIIIAYIVEKLNYFTITITKFLLTFKYAGVTGRVLGNDNYIGSSKTLYQVLEAVHRKEKH